MGILPTFHTIFTCHLSSPIITAIFTMILHWFLVASSKLRKACQKYHSSVCHNSGLEQYWRKISKIAVLAAAVKAASEVNARALLYCCLTRACYATLRALDFCERGMASTCAVTPFTNQLVSWIPLQGSALFFSKVWKLHPLKIVLWRSQTWFFWHFWSLSNLEGTLACVFPLEIDVKNIPEHWRLLLYLSLAIWIVE